MRMRISPANQPYSPTVQALFDRLPQSWSPPFKLFTVLARDERLLKRFMNASTSYLQPSYATVRQREALLLRVTARCKCPYEWGMRVHYFSTEAALGDEHQYATVYGTCDDPVWTPTDRLLIRLADELEDTIAVSDELWSGMKTVFSDEAIIQLLLMAGYYRTVCCLANGLRLPLEPVAGRPFPDRKH
jgi:alkylhydroperoxidase family enzyme